MAIVISPPLVAALAVFVLIVKVPFWMSISPPSKLTEPAAVLMIGFAPEKTISLSVVLVPPDVVMLKAPLPVL